MPQHETRNGFMPKSLNRQIILWGILGTQEQIYFPNFTKASFSGHFFSQRTAAFADSRGRKPNCRIVFSARCDVEAEVPSAVVWQA
jgi:hypothetical protein